MEIGVQLSNNQLRLLAEGEAVGLLLPSPLADREGEITVVFLDLPPDVQVSAADVSHYVHVDVPGDGTGVVRLLGTLTDAANSQVTSKLRCKVSVVQYTLRNRDSSPSLEAIRLQWPRDLFQDGVSIITANKTRKLFF